VGARIAAALAVSLLSLAAGCGGGGAEHGKSSAETAATSRQRGVRLEAIGGGGFEQPLYVTQPPGSSDLYVVERTGKVVIVRDGEKLATPFLDISPQVSTEVEQGMLSITFAPDYQRSGLLYAYYSDRRGNQRIVEMRRSADNPDRTDGKQRLVLEMADYAPNHNGGLIVFGPDGHMYVGTGDGGGSGDPRRNAQNLGSLLGKLLRIDPREVGGDPYSVPADNPFTGRAGARPEVYAYGLRNPWRFAFDTGSGALTIGDVGQDRFEEIDVVAPGAAAGANFGWSALEGDSPFNSDQRAPGAVKPALVYSHDEGCSVNGGYVVRDRELPSLAGRYVYSDFCAGQLRSFKLSGTKASDDKPLGLEVSSPTSFGTDNAGHIYVTTLDGDVFRLAPGRGP
jgi:glucose/arabinose dehydrogenase